VEARTEASPGGSPAANIRFGPFELDVRAAELCKHGIRIRLQDQPFQILRMLLECPGEVVLREEIRNQLWPNDTVVEFDHSINAAVKRLRDALGESADKPRYIETLARRGYRFIGQVETPASQPLNAPPLVIVQRRNGDLATSRPPQPSDRLRRLIPVLLVTLILLALAGAWYYRRGAPARWVRNIALPEVNRLVAAENHPAAFPLLYQALQILPQDPVLNRIRREITHPIPIRTTPPGASVYVKPYDRPDTPWTLIGQSPLEDFLLPLGFFRWRFTKPGFRTVEGAAGIGAAGIQGSSIDFILDPEGSIPTDMVHVPRGASRMFNLDLVHTDDFWIDRYEVTNKQFKEFVDKGGYRNRQYWREEFVKDGRSLSWEQAMLEFRDPTGRPGPSTWEVGDYPRGHDDFPVNGVSWYEAAAYAEFAGKRLPTAYHWTWAANPQIYSDILEFSNFDGAGPAPVGSRKGIGPFGTYDMAGNVKEWCWNATGNRRYILGGSWNEWRAAYTSPEARSPFDRSPANGFRCVKYPGVALSDELARPVDKPAPDHRMERPVSDSAFRILQSLYSYDHTELNARKESVDDSSPYRKAERITFDAAYDRQRVIAWLYLPRNAKPPYQTIIFFPSGHSRSAGSIDDAEIQRMDFLIRSGRAVLFPEYQGTFERRPKEPLGPSALRDQAIQQCKDFQRSVDYLETRADVVRDRLGFFGISSGAGKGLIILALEPRIRAAVLGDAGLSGVRRPPEIDQINFTPRVRIPVLMLNGRYDFVDPVETGQLPLFRLLGTPEKDKRYVLFDRGHRGPTYQYIRESLDWFDRYLGPVNR
jgi:DNA-binding winged helix-turn-helix (wHTH) protein/dienelactone hydrolase